MQRCYNLVKVLNWKFYSVWQQTTSPLLFLNGVIVGAAVAETTGSIPCSSELQITAQSKISGITNIETVWDLSAGMGQTLKWVCNFIFHQGGRGGKSHVLSCNARRLDGPLIVRTLIPVRHTYTRTLCWMIGYRGWFRLLLCRTSENA